MSRTRAITSRRRRTRLRVAREHWKPAVEAEGGADVAPALPAQIRAGLNATRELGQGRCDVSVERLRDPRIQLGYNTLGSAWEIESLTLADSCLNVRKKNAPWSRQQSHHPYRVCAASADSGSTGGSQFQRCLVSVPGAAGKRKWAPPAITQVLTALHSCDDSSKPG
jgi:hypothetical protein